MKDKIKEINSQNMQIPKLKGRTTIVLRNADTGEVEKEVVEENMVTNAVARMFASNWCGQLDYSKLMPIATKALGGVLCFPNAITEDADNIYPPMTSENNLTAHAGQATYVSAGEDPKRGNPNNIVSGITSRGYSNTWDFAATQGNGLISSICLTHADFGDYFCYGKNQFSPVETVLLSRLENNFIDQEGHMNTRYVMDKTRNLAYGFYLNNTKLFLRKHKHFGLIKQDVVSAFPVSADHTDVEITLGHAHSTWSVYLFDEIANTLTFIIPRSNGSNTLNRDIINLSNNSVTSDEIVVSGASFLSVDYTSRYTNNSLTKSGRLYLPSTRNTFYGIKYSQPTDTIETVNQSGYSINLQAGFFAVNGDYIACGNSIIEGNKNYEAKIAPLGDWAEFLKPVQVDASPIKASIPYQRYTNPKSTGPVLNKMYLGTINNLETPVTKTSAQTMTITYELIMEE